MARPATANALKSLQGTSRPDRTQPTGVSEEFEPVALMPPPPAWMTDAWALDEWHKLGPILLRVGLLTKGTLNGFAQLCSLHGELATGYQNKQSPQGTTLNAYIKLITEFGLTPAAAGKISHPDPVQQGNKFRNNGKS